MDREPELRKVVAEAYVNGATNAEIAELLQRGVHADTITDYKRHPAVRAIALRLTEERHLQITSKIDNALMGRLNSHIDKIDIETLLKIRKEVLPERIEIKDTTNRQAVVEELLKLSDSDPAAAKLLMEANESAAAAEVE